MTDVQLNDLIGLGRRISKFTTDMVNYRAIVNGRMSLAKGLRNKYPNMTIDAIRSFLWKQEQEQAKAVQLEFDELRMYAVSVGWEIEYKDIRAEVVGLTEGAPKLNEINV